MPDTTEHNNKTHGTRKNQLLWFIGLYLAGLAATGLAVYILRALLGLG